MVYQVEVSSAADAEAEAAYAWIAARAPVAAAR
jgi:hypothetical protein